MHHCGTPPQNNTLNTTMKHHHGAPHWSPTVEPYYGAPSWGANVEPHRGAPSWSTNMSPPRSTTSNHRLFLAGGSVKIFRHRGLPESSSVPLSTDVIGQLNLEPNYALHSTQGKRLFTCHNMALKNEQCTKDYFLL